MKRARRFLVYAIARIASFFVGFLPPRSARRLGRSVGGLVYWLARRERGRVLDHLEAAYGDEMSKTERRRVAEACFRNFTGSIFELFSTGRRGPKSVADLIGPDEDLSRLEEALSRGRGVLLFTAHINNWELMGSYLVSRGMPLVVVGRRLNDSRFDGMITRWRSSMGVRTIYQDEGARPLLRVMRDGSVLGILPDQDVPRLAGMFVDFFGRPAWTPTGPAGLAVSAKAPAIGVFMVRKGARHTVVTTDVIEPPTEGSKAERVEELTRTMTAEIEKLVRAHPEQWAWMHRRWRTRPEDAGDTAPGEPGED